MQGSRAARGGRRLLAGALPLFRRTAGFGSLIAGIAVGAAQVFSPGTAWAQKVDLPAGVAKVLAERSPATVDDLRQIERQVARVVERVLPATVGLRIGNGMGSGVVVNREGLILTAGHVVGEAGQRATVIFPDGRRLPGYTLGADHDCDAGMVELLDPPADLVYCPLAEGDELAAGTWVVATGQPGGVVAHGWASRLAGRSDEDRGDFVPRPRRAADRESG